MRYERPIVMELGSRAQARGQGPQACIAGGAATGQQVCDAGSDGYTPYPTDCLAGGSPTGYTYMACAAGGSANWECSAGGDGGAFGCVAGPSAT